MVVDGQGNPRAGVPVGTYIPHDRCWWSRTDPQGRFVLHSLNGIGRDPLDVDFDFNDHKVVFRNVPIGTKELKCVKHLPGQISGVLLDQHGEHPLTNYEVKVERVHLLDCAGMVLGPAVGVTRSGPPGAFRIAQVLQAVIPELRWRRRQGLPSRSDRARRFRPADYLNRLRVQGTALYPSRAKHNVGLRSSISKPGRDCGE
jgi:hypothetical protein